MVGYSFLVIIVMSLVAFYVGRAAANGFLKASSGRGSIHSLPGYHGAFVAVWVGIPALVLVLLWAAMQGPVIDHLLVASLPESLTAGATPGQISVIVSQVKNAAAGALFGTPSPEVLAAAERFRDWQTIASAAMVVATLCITIIALLVARSRLAPRFRARNRFEQVISGLMIASATVAIVTTLGIIASLVFEASRFFALVPVQEFLFGLRWEPQIAIRADQVAGAGAFGAVPVFVGTVVIATIAMVVATPIGIYTAIYLTEFAGKRTRSIVKPTLEILAGIPTVVYGFFALLVVAPAVREFGGIVGIPFSPNSAFVAGAVMGIMIIPFISSLSDDAIAAVPRSMRDGSLALGSTRSETVMRVLLPAALPGIVGGILLGVSRAIGETMIVVMAAGLIANLTINPLDSVTTVTVQIVTLLIGDTAFDNPKTLAAFALGLVLFVMTLILNVIAIRIVRKYREQYD